jgi:hypothetical protein
MPPGAEIVGGPAVRAAPSCQLAAQARAFVDTLGVNRVYLDSKHDRCYCEACYPARYPDTFSNDGPTEYVVPRGWYRFGLAFGSESKAKSHDIFNQWDASYHGVKSKPVLDSILDGGLLMKAGDTLLDGTVLRSTKCAERQDKCFYTSPTIKYAGLKFYAEPQPFGDRLAASMVLICRQKPDSYDRRGQTMGFDQWPGHLSSECPHIDPGSVEYFSEINTGAIPTGLLVRPFVWGADAEIYHSPRDSKCGWRHREQQAEAEAAAEAERKVALDAVLRAAWAAGGCRCRMMDLD